MNQVITSLAAAEDYAAKNGIRLTAADRDAIARAQVAEQKRLQLIREQRQTDTNQWVDTFNRVYPRFLEALIGVGEVILTLTQTLIIAFGVPTVLVLLLIVEQQRVVHGITLFETDASLASFAATALVLLNLTLEFTIEYIENRAGFSVETSTKFSLRTWLQQFAYWLGIGRNWNARTNSPAQRYKQLLRLVTFSILALALAGSMRSVIEQAEGTWLQALVNVATQSSLGQMMTWLGGLLFAAAAVLAAQGLSRYVAVRCVEIIANMQSKQVAGAINTEDMLDSVAVQYILARVAEKQAKSFAKENNTPEVVSTTTPFQVSSETSPG
ncbi:MAG: hypothetical protein IPK17_22695 [Chloroflexi bacterium]|uniref:hypothetical protein n=1 Tax=Candidatus Flexifilum breve TaxID=3140694 RepID=UPI003134C47C|nr:hypothetical protein [Chloroflexota bacterium]